MSWENTDARVVRSYTDPSVWVPVTPFGDMQCFLYAGPLRKVRAYILDQLDSEGVYRWQRGEEDGQQTWEVWQKVTP